MLAVAAPPTNAARPRTAVIATAGTRGLDDDFMVGLVKGAAEREGSSPRPAPRRRSGKESVVVTVVTVVIVTLVVAVVMTLVVVVQ